MTSFEFLLPCYGVEEEVTVREPNNTGIDTLVRHNAFLRSCRVSHVSPKLL